MRILSRTCLGEATRLFFFYLSAYALLTALAVSTPLLHKGAPFSAVIGFIPYQLLYTAPFLVPLALCTAILSCLGRMREDGELIALRSVGISAFYIVRGILPLILALGLFMSALQHFILPEVSLAIRAGRSDLVRQGVSTRINRGEAIWRQKNRGQMLMAQGTDGLHLHHLVAHNSGGPGRDMFVYAPHGTWRYKDDLHLESQDLRFIDLRRHEDGRLYEVITGTVPRSSQIIRSSGVSERQQDKADVKHFTELNRDIQVLRQELRDQRQPGYSIHDRGHRHTQEQLRNHQYTWHTRMAIPYSLLAYFLLAAGLALSLPIRNRLLALFIGTLLIIANLLPGMIAVKGMGQYLRFNPGILIWLPNTITAVIGSLLIWRKR